MYFMNAYKTFPEAGSDRFITYAVYFSVCGIYIYGCFVDTSIEVRSLFFSADCTVANASVRNECGAVFLLCDKSS
jgi:hypothetical protein